MDELELLKSHWKKETSSSKHSFNSNDIYQMLHKKSSNIVKTLFYISIAELLLWICLNVIPLIFSDSYGDAVKKVYGEGYLAEIATAISYAIIILFIVLLYKSYKSISTLDNAKKLMEKILRTRSIVRYYVLYNLIIIGVSMVFGFYFTINHDAVLIENMSRYSSAQMTGFYAGIVIGTIVFIGIIWLFYKLLYGILLKRLNRNYKELRRLEL
jgi:hypothetical protein